MHELAICQALIEQVEAIARERFAQRVDTVCVSIGPLSGVEPRLLEQAFPVASAGTVADGACLKLDCLPLRVSCQQCGRVTDALPSRLTCGHCGDWHTELVSGDELILSRVELLQAEREHDTPAHTAPEIPKIPE
jgi:hydrogenase nickel incorporation protein HypA/HybF